LDERGCLQIYASDLNAELLITNDLVELKSDKKFKFLGRIDNVINSAGLKIHPEQLENLIKKEIPNEVIFLGIEDVLLGQKLVLIMEGNKSEAIIHKLEKISYPSKNHQPKEVIFIEKIPRIPNGKVDRRELSKIIDNRLKK
jgi:O-succinylbenzoic acid--CoA ligase